MPFNLLCPLAAGQDGMPLVLSHTVASSSIQASDFVVTSQSGEQHVPLCATTAPANDPGETRTVLLFGEFGNATNDLPVRVEIVGSVVTDTGLEFAGVSTDNIIALESGPTLVHAEILDVEQWQNKGRGTLCPPESAMVIRATWTGGVSYAETMTDNEVREAYSVEVETEKGELEITPFALADLNDNDNNHDLCLDVVGTPTYVSVSAYILVDPNNDPNPETTVEIN